MLTKFEIYMELVIILITSILILLCYLFERYVLHNKVKFKDAVASMIVFSVLFIVGGLLAPLFTQLIEFVYKITN